MTEAHDFRSRCASHVAARDAELAAQRYKRGLLIQWASSPKEGVFTNMWGAGHTLPAACRLHQLCRRVRRFCYISIYDTSFEDYFGYANGLSWKPRREEMRRYTRKHSKKVTLNFQCNATRHIAKRHEPFIEGELLRAIEAADDKELVKVTVRGWLPMVNVLPYTSANLPEEESRCACRYVTEPLHKQRPALARWLYGGNGSGGGVGGGGVGGGAASLARATALHLRTGFADLSSALVALGLRRDAAATARYVAAACGPDPFADGAPRFVMSDSPGLLRYLSARYPHVLANELPENTSTRSWFTTNDVKFATYDDLVVAGAAARLQVAPQQRLFWPGARSNPLPGRPRSAMLFSGFARAVLARSVGLRRVQPQVPECPRYAHVFPRDYPQGVEGRLVALGVRFADLRAGATKKPAERPASTSGVAKQEPGCSARPTVACRRASEKARKFAKVQAQLAAYHPCRNQSDDLGACLVDAIGALK